MSRFYRYLVIGHQLVIIDHQLVTIDNVCVCACEPCNLDDPANHCLQVSNWVYDPDHPVARG